MSDPREPEATNAEPEAADEAPPRRRIPVVHFESWIDRQIQRAQERGEFDNLAGAGRPLPPADQNEAFAGDDAMGLHLLKNAEALPAWIELNKEIAAEQATCRRILAYYQAERDRDRRARFARDYRRHVEELNRKIEHYNLIVPARHLEKVSHLADRDLRDADRRRWAMLDREERARRQQS